jgi:UDP-N-acetylglucosamine 2-epimerase (non-hydrolysing)
LVAEGVSPDRIFVTGNTVVDTLLAVLTRVRTNPPPIPGLDPNQLGGSNRLVLITGHRRESFGEGFEAICRAIAILARQFPNVRFVYPVHPNPNVREPVTRILGAGAKLANVLLIEPLEYVPFVALMARATLILTDSGGVQEEAPTLGKPVLLMRTTTERPEAVRAGSVKLVGTDPKRIVEEVSSLLTDPSVYESMSRSQNLYGDGKASERIAAICGDFLERNGLRLKS